MARFIIKIKDRYLEWSTIVDAPVTISATLEDFKEYYLAEYGQSSADELAERLERVEAKGTSSHIHSSLGDCIAGNRAGDNEETLTLDEIYEKYCKDEAKK